MKYASIRQVSAIARRYFVRGRVQGVGFRNYVQQHAVRIGVSGYTRNLADGRVEVYACGTHAQLDELDGLLYQGPRWADVHGVDIAEAAPSRDSGFHIKG